MAEAVDVTTPVAPVDRFLPIAEVVTLSGLSASTLRRWIDQGRFPRPITLAATVHRWRMSDIVAWQATAISAAMGEPAG